MKMYLLALALIYTFTVRRKVAFADEGRFGVGHDEGRRPAVDRDVAVGGRAGAIDYDDPGQHVRISGGVGNGLYDLLP